MLVSFAVAGLALLVAGGEFAYGQFLSHVETARAAELQKQQDSVSDQTVKDYIHLKDRIASSETLLDNHVILSRFFDDLEGVTLQNVQFKSLTITVAGDGSAKVDMSGVAKNFNALAVESNTIASDKNFKSAILSGFALDSTNHVQFKLTADIDPALIHLTKKDVSSLAPAVPQPVPQSKPATSTATTTL